MRNAFLAGTLIALACGLVGYFLVLRAQVFTSDALGHVAFTAALGALAFGLDPRLGLFAGTILVALAMAALGRRASADDVVIGSTFAWVLGLGVLFLTLYTTQRSTANGVASVNYLFGSIFGLSSHAGHQARRWSPRRSPRASLLIARPLLFASLDEAVAAAAGVPVRAAGRRLSGAGGRNDRRGHPGGRRAARARSGRGAGRRRPAAHAAALRSARPLGRVFAWCDVDRPYGELPGAARAAELRDHRGRQPHVPAAPRSGRAPPEVDWRAGPEGRAG